MMVISIIGLILLLALGFHASKKYKEFSNNEKILFFVTLIIYFVPVIMYIFDKYNIPSKYHYFDNVDPSKWFDFAVTYVSTVAGSIISGTILVLITISQINIQYESNRENKRIENIPLLDYEISDDSYIKCDYCHTVLLKETGDLYDLIVKIENIGLNHCRDLSFLTKVDDEEDRIFFLEDEKSFLKKGETIIFKLIFNLKSKPNVCRKINFITHYTDLLNNIYEKEIEISIDFVEEAGTNKLKMRILNIIIKKEELINNN